METTISNHNFSQPVRKHLALTRAGAKVLKERLQNCAEMMRYKLSGHFSDGDRFVTLTFRPNKNIDEIERSKTVREFLHRLNRAVFGAEYRRHKKRLSYTGFFEVGASGNLHLHALIGTPRCLSRLKGESFDSLIKRTWVRLGLAGKKCGQDSQCIYNVDRAYDYIAKDVKTSTHYANFDADNFHVDRTK